MAARELATSAIVAVSFLMLLAEVPLPVSAFVDKGLVGNYGCYGYCLCCSSGVCNVCSLPCNKSPRDTTNHNSDDMGDNLRELLKLMGVMLESRNGNRALRVLGVEKPFRSVASPVILYKKNDWTSLLDRLSSLSQEEPEVISSTTQKSYQDFMPVLTSKRGRDELVGAMPPMNEFCRMLGVKCY